MFADSLMCFTSDINMLQKLRQKFNALRLNYQSARRKVRLSRTIPREMVSHLDPTTDIQSKWYGSSYGGFFIIPTLLQSSSIVYSFGIGKDISFDEKVINEHGCNIYAFDPTPNSIKWIAGQKLSPLFQFHPYGISVHTGVATFYLPANPKYVSGSLNQDNTTPENVAVEVQMQSLNDICQKFGHTHIDVLKMDIEGAEYDVLENILSLPITIDQICVEFHDRNTTSSLPKSKATTALLKQYGYEIYAASISFEEVSFVHKRKLK
ncbi:MAG: FkbM family methyltransferase [Bacteroidota bacterium]|nr:FkbM family methyltransferase [Bacteroidota bacterium]